MTFRTHRTSVIVAALHVGGWGVLLATVLVPGAGVSSTAALGLGIGGTAYALGLRHAFDADHIAAIDNTTRRLVATGRTSSGVGLWFSLGHSSVVTALCVLVAVGVRGIDSLVSDPTSGLHRWTGVIGPTVSAVFLVAIAIANLVGLLRRRGASHTHGGPVAALLGRLGVVADRPSRMFVVGLLFGLGFDTATEVGLLALAGTSAASRDWWSVLALPVVFAAGMSFLDSAQGAMSRRAYTGGRSTTVVTAVSIVAALIIAAVELAGVLSANLHVPAFLTGISGGDVASLGLWLTAVLLAAWGINALLPALPFTVDRKQRT